MIMVFHQTIMSSNSEESDNEDDAICIKCKREIPDSWYLFKDDFICDECQDKKNCIRCNDKSISPMLASICSSCSKEGWSCYYDYCYEETFCIQMPVNIYHNLIYM